MSDSIAVKVAKERQANRTTAAAGAGAHYLARSGGGATYTVQRADDPTVTATQNPKDNPRLNAENTYGFEAPFGAAHHHKELEDGLRSTFSTNTAITAQTDIAAVNTGNKLTSVTSGKFDSLSAFVGYPVLVSGFTQLSEATWSRIVSVTTGASPELALDSTWLDLSDEAAGDSVTIRVYPTLTEGITLHWSTIEEEYQSGDFTPWYAMACESLALSAGNASRITLNGSYKGALRAIAGSGAPATSSIFTTPTSAPSTPTFAAPHVNVMRQGGATQTLGLMSWDFTVQNTLNPATPQGGVGASNFASNKRSINGNLSLYRDEGAAITTIHAMKNAARNGTDHELAWYMESDDGLYGYWIVIGKANYTGATPTTGSGGENLALQLPWMAKEDAYGHMIYITYFTA